MIPLRLFRDRTTSLATVASVLIGVAMFGSTVYLVAVLPARPRMSPTEAGLMSVAMVGGLLVSSIVSGRHHHPDRPCGSASWSAAWSWSSSACCCSRRSTTTTPLVSSGAFMAVLGLGLGATMQNLVLAVQNNTAQADMGAASSVVAFFRSMGGSVGRLGARCRARPPGRRRGDRRARAGWASRAGGSRQPTADPRPRDAARADPRRLRARLRRRDRPHLPGGRCRSRSARWSRVLLHQGGAAAHHRWTTSDRGAARQEPARRRAASGERPASAPCTPSSRRWGS